MTRSKQQLEKKLTNYTFSTCNLLLKVYNEIKLANREGARSSDQAEKASVPKGKMAAKPAGRLAKD